MTQRITAFPPILPDKPHTLILGTMPGGKSLEAGQYYAHPQNQFWKFMGDIFGAYPALPYEQRLQILQDQGIALWDVLRACTRQGSLDAAIKNEEANDFATFYREYPTVERVVFSSKTAETLYHRRVMPTLTKPLRYLRVPSPSPAYASMPYAAKLALWEDALQPR